MPADQKRFGLGKTTPREITTLMNKFVACDLGSPAGKDDAQLCKAALHMLHAQFYREGIPRYLDTLPGAANDSIANKSGALDASRSDVAAVSTRHGIVLISIYTYDNADQSWTPDDEGDLTIARLARAIVNAWSPAALRPGLRSRSLNNFILPTPPLIRLTVVNFLHARQRIDVLPLVCHHGFSKCAGSASANPLAWRSERIRLLNATSSTIFVPRRASCQNLQCMLQKPRRELLNLGIGQPE